MANLQLEQTAPDFTLPTQHDNKLVKLSDFRGKNVVLYFYPKDNTPGCTIEAKEFNSLKDEFSKLNTVVFGVSKDDTKSHKNFADKCSLNFDLLADVTGDVSLQYGVLVEKSMFGKKYMGLQRATFLIDTDGKIAYIWPKAGFMGHAKEVLVQVKKIGTIAG
ncbi:MAG: thioredoxin-dependent thiol peroxidase [Rickettsiaceae bacterium]|nr:thioredoxin-dependent thiol peroxidase [Rickettsiaceae bacterium]